MQNVKAVSYYGIKSGKIDTIYYLLDTMRVPKNDRLVKISGNAYDTDISILCQCLNTSEKNIFLNSQVKRNIVIDKATFKSLKLTTLAALIGFIQNHNTTTFGSNVVYIVQPSNNKYILHRVINISNRGGVVY